MKKGVSLISLIITIVVIIILASITVINSLSTAEDAFLVKNENEFNDVCNFVKNVSTKLEADLITINIPEERLVTSSQITDEFYVSDSSDFTGADMDKIHAMNESIPSERNGKYGYYYITAKQIENGVPGLDIPSDLTNVENNYIINFYYGVVIAKVSNTQVDVFGRIR